MYSCAAGPNGGVVDIEKFLEELRQTKGPLKIKECPVCGKRFKMKSTMVRHINWEHLESESPFLCLQTAPSQDTLAEFVKQIGPEVCGDRTEAFEELKRSFDAELKVKGQEDEDVNFQSYLSKIKSYFAAKHSNHASLHKWISDNLSSNQANLHNRFLTTVLVSCVNGTNVSPKGNTDTKCAPSTSSAVPNASNNKRGTKRKASSPAIEPVHAETAPVEKGCKTAKNTVVKSFSPLSLDVNFGGGPTRPNGLLHASKPQLAQGKRPRGRKSGPKIVDLPPPPSPSGSQDSSSEPDDARPKTPAEICPFCPDEMAFDNFFDKIDHIGTCHQAEIFERFSPRRTGTKTATNGAFLTSPKSPSAETLSKKFGVGSSYGLRRRLGPNVVLTAELLKECPHLKRSASYFEPGSPKIKREASQEPNNNTQSEDNAFECPFCEQKWFQSQKDCWQHQVKSHSEDLFEQSSKPNLRSSGSFSHTPNGVNNDNSDSESCCHSESVVLRRGRRKRARYNY